MPVVTPTPNLLQELYALGEQMRTALEAGEIDEFGRLVVARGAVLQRLSDYAGPADIDPDWEETATALKRQHDSLTHSMAEEEQRVEEALNALARFKDARQTYTAAPSSDARGILNPELRG